jgi:hypothetical protein
MTISEYACELCEYRYEGCGGLGLLESGWGRQTISCRECEALHDVELGLNLRTGSASADPPVRRGRQKPPRTEDVLAELAFACPVDASHAVRPWTDGEPRMAVPGAIVGECPRCGEPLRLLRTVLLAD